MPGLTAGGNATITADSGDVLVTDVTAAGDAVVYSLQGKVAQQQNTVLSGETVTVSSETGIEIASIQATGDITLVINQSTVATGEPTPSFTRVNDPISHRSG